MIGIAARLRSRLVQRIYFVGILQFIIVVGGSTALVRASRRPPVLADTVRFLTHELTAESDRPDAFDGAVQRIHADMHWAVAVYDDNGRLLASGGPLTPPSSSAGERSRFEGDLQPSGSVPLDLYGGKVGRLDYRAPKGPGPPLGPAWIAVFVLVVVGVTSWLTARSLAIPLARVAATANAFGAGDLSARARLRRSDELGDVANAFDQMAARVTQSIRAERELLANISHELRTPLQRIRLALDLAAEGGADTARDSLLEIAEDLAELERLVVDVLEAARLSLRGEGHTTAVPPRRDERVDARQLLERAAMRFRSAHPGRPLDMSIDADAMVSGDPVMLRRVIDNLLDNAHKYSSDESSPVTVRSCVADGAFVIEVADAGIGISREDLPRVFEPFFRADRSRTRASGGVGLGLALAKRIVGAHGGHLTVQSELGRGTTVRIELPRADGIREGERRVD